MKAILERDKTFYKKIFVIALPIIIQNFITSSLNIVDTIMIGKLGEVEIASVGIGNQYFFLFNILIMGMFSGMAVYTSQYWGRKDIASIKKVVGLGSLLAVIIGLIFTVVALISPSFIVSIFNKSTDVIRLGSEYLGVVCLSYVFTALTFNFATALRCIEKTSIPMLVSAVALLTNTFLNWVFIFGNLGFEPMGVNGAALATTIARLVEMIFIVSFVYFRKNKVASRLNELISFDLNFVKIYFRTSWSVIVNEIVWSLGMTAYSIAYARIGTNAVASMQIATTLNNMFMVLLIGLATASSIMIGNKIGSNEEEIAREYAKDIAVIAVLVGFILGILIWITAPLALKPFNVSEGTYLDTVKVLRIIGLFFTIRAFNMVMIVGVFRGGGDTTYSMLVQCGTIWLYAVPMAFLGATVFSLPVYGVYFLICTEEFLKIIFEAVRLKSGKWIKNVISDIEEDESDDNLITV